VSDDTRERTCPACGTTSRTRWEDCPACGASFFAPPPAVVRRRRAVRWGVAGAGVAIACAVALPLLLSDKSHREARERVATARLVSAERARIARYQAPHDGEARSLRPGPHASAVRRLAARAALVRALEAAITHDAQARAVRHELDGPISGAQCGPLLRSPDAVPDDRVLAKPIGRYDCVAAKADVRSNGRSVGTFGYPFVAALDFRRFTYTWCRNTPAHGEAGKALVFVRLDRRCLAATGPAVGSGYADVAGG
jgi:hypothetical protein